MDDHTIRRNAHRQLWKARERIKQDSCLLCNNPIQSIINSHSVPQFVLKTIAEKGLLYQSSILTGATEYLDLNKGVSNSGIFRLLCSDCDNKYFKDYESPELIINPPTDLFLAEIALKNSLLTYERQREFKELLKINHQYRLPGNVIANYDNIDLNSRDAKDDIGFYKSIIDNNETDGFHVITRLELNYIVPIATQTSIVLDYDYEGKIVNIIKDFPIQRQKLQAMHLVVFPLEDRSIILLFYHKRDRNYRDLRHQFNRLSMEKQLSYINYLIFAYSENYYFSPFLSKDILNNPLLIELSKKVYPHFQNDTRSHKLLLLNDIPNFLSKEYSINPKYLIE